MSLISKQSILIAATLLFAAPLLAQTKPATITATPEQQAFLDSLRNQPADKPAMPLVTKLTTATGEPNPNFGKRDPVSLEKFQRHNERKKKPIGLLFLGDSITEAWNRAGDLWKERYAPYDAANFGIAGERTQHTLWRIQEGALDGIDPKVVVLLIGTNNVGRHSGPQIASGVTEIVRQIHLKLPNTKVLLMGIFPRSEKPDATRAKIQEANALIAKLDDGNKTRYLEIWNQFLAPDGTLPPDLMPDALHPSPKGYRIWADAMQPLLDEMLKESR